VDRSLNPRVASLNESKTMALTDLARAMKEEGKPVRPLRGECGCTGSRSGAFTGDWPGRR